MGRPQSYLTRQPPRLARWRRFAGGFTTRMPRSLAAVVLVSLTVASIALVAGAGATAHAAPRSPSAEPFPVIPLNGTTQRGRFTGRLTVTRVVASGDRLVASGTLGGRLRDSRYPSAQDVTIRRFSVVLGVTATPGATDCASVTMAIPSVRTRLIGLRARLAARTFPVAPKRGGPRAVRDILCATSQTLTAQPPAPGVAPSPVVVHLLNALRLVHA